MYFIICLNLAKNSRKNIRMKKNIKKKYESNRIGTGRDGREREKGFSLGVFKGGDQKQTLIEIGLSMKTLVKYLSRYDENGGPRCFAKR